MCIISCFLCIKGAKLVKYRNSGWPKVAKMCLKWQKLAVLGYKNPISLNGPSGEREGPEIGYFLQKRAFF